MADKNQQARVVRFGRIKAVIWKNEGTNGGPVMYNATVSRIYKDPATDTWKDSSSLGRDELLIAAKALEEAFCWICRQSENDSR